MLLGLRRRRHLPPITGQLPTTGDVSRIRNNGDRRFFLPYPVSTQPVRSIQLSYDGDPGWNGRADPSRLADGTGVVWWESLVTAPACGGSNPLACPTSPVLGAEGLRELLEITRDWAEGEESGAGTGDLGFGGGERCVRALHAVSVAESEGCVCATRHHSVSRRWS